MKILKPLLFTLLLCLSQILAAKDVGVYNLTSHWGYLSLYGGPFLLQDNSEEVSSKPFLTIGLSAGYEYRYSAFWTSVGLDLQYWAGKMTTERTYLYDQQLYDTQGKLMYYHYQIGTSAEVPQGLFLNVPVLVGFHAKGFYMGAGIKIGAGLLSFAKVTRPYQTSATYPQYIDDFGNMPGHFYSDYKTTNFSKITMQWPISAIAEIGYDVFANLDADFAKRYRLKIGLYAEYGLKNIWKNDTENSVFIVNSEHPTQLQYNAHYASFRSTEESKVIPMSAGLKITVLFRVPTKDCNCL